MRKSMYLKKNDNLDDSITFCTQEYCTKQKECARALSNIKFPKYPHTFAKFDCIWAEKEKEDIEMDEKFHYEINYKKALQVIQGNYSLKQKLKAGELLRQVVAKATAEKVIEREEFDTLTNKITYKYYCPICSNIVKNSYCSHCGQYLPHIDKNAQFWGEK